MDTKVSAFTEATSYATTDLLRAVVGGNDSRLAASTLFGKIPAAPLPSSAAGFDLGSATLPWKDLWFAGSSGTPGTNNFKITGASTSGTRTITFPDASSTVALVGFANVFTTSQAIQPAADEISLVVRRNGAAQTANVVEIQDELNNLLVGVSKVGAFSFPDNVRQTFNPGADAAGLNVGSIAGDPGTPANGDLWYDSTAHELTARINGASIALGVSANPTGTVGLAAVNGSATTFLRSDGAPALSQAIVPTWTGVHTFSPAARSSGVAPYLKITTPADTGQTADAEFPGIVFGGDASHATVIRTGADGTTIAEQREYRFVPPTYAFAGATTLTRAISLYAASPIVGTSATFTSGIGALFEASAAAHVPLVIRGAGSQSGNLTRWTDSTNANLALISSTGQVFAAGGTAGFSWLTQTSSDIHTFSTSYVIHTQAGQEVFGITTTHLEMSKPIKWNATGITTTIDTGLGRNGAGVLEVTNGTAGQWGALKCGVRDTGTNTVINGLTIGHQLSSGTADVAMGSGVLFNINSSTTADQNAAQVAGVWSTATHASRTADLKISLVQGAAALAERARFRSEGGLLLSSASGQANLVSVLTEETTLSTSGATTDTAIQLPANSIILSVTGFVTVTIADVNSTSLQIGDAAVATRFGSITTLTAGGTTVGLNHFQGSVAADNAGPVQVSAAAVRLTLAGGGDNTPSAGKVRVTIHYMQLTAATA